jgi:cyclopropane fatty-acyl-phospholipid synthase-like methyltransferase
MQNTLAHEKHLIEYYEAFEILLENARTISEYRTHFGILDQPSKDYCFFKAIAKPAEYPHITLQAQKAMDVLHERLFHHKSHQPKSVLDVGFGSGGTLHKLSEEWTNTDISGINLNPKQYHIAQDLLSTKKNVELHLANFLTHPFTKKYDLIYFIESAFHILEKEVLCNKISDLLNDDGEVYIVDILYSEKLLQKKPNIKQIDEEIFDYMSLENWITRFSHVGLDFVSFENLSPSVANHTTVNTTLEEFKENYIQTALDDSYENNIHAERLIEAFHGYKKLSKFLKIGLLEYGILRFKKNNL